MKLSERELMENKKKMRTKQARFAAMVAVLLFIFFAFKAYAEPVGPTVSYISNSTLGTTANATVNMTGANGTAGGYIFTVNLEAEQQNRRWKGYVGNVTGSLVLADSSGYKLYDWSIAASLRGQIYASRSSSPLNWGGITCANITHIGNEEIAMNHTSNPTDNITVTFPDKTNTGFTVATRDIDPNDCYTTNLYVNSTAPAGDVFEELLLYDGTNIIYTALVDGSKDGYHEGRKFDFQMILPERGYAAWTGSTAYYFYVELA